MATLFAPRLVLASLLLLLGFMSEQGFSQQVCLPSPRLLTLMPMGAKAGTSVEVTMTGENLEEVSQLLFSSSKISAKPVLGSDGKPVENKFLVTVAADAPLGVHDARVLSRLGVSSARAFTVGQLKETTATQPHTTLATALALEPGSVCNAVMTRRAVDYYSFKAVKGQRVLLDIAAAGIDSKLTPVLIVADDKGGDLIVNRKGGALEFDPPSDGSFIIKVHGLTFQGGPESFYRLALQAIPASGPAPQLQARTERVSAMSWPAPGIAAKAAANEAEPNNEAAKAQKISLPCDIAGSFFPAADVDTFEFTAKKGEVWWVEVASERLGLNTDPFVLVQQVAKAADGKETLTDVAELYDIASPMKVSTNGYSYDGPPYDPGSPDVLGKFEVKADGLHRLQLRDLFGGTRNEPYNAYRLIVRRAAPDFALAAWAVHMTLRNGDRAALSKPIALRAGAAMAFEVAIIRRDGFDGEVSIAMDGLPAGVHASGLKIAAGKSFGHLIIHADAAAKDAFATARITGTASINGASVSRPCRVASMKWPARDGKQDTPAPRLMADVPVSVTASEAAPLTLATGGKLIEARVGETVKVPLQIAWRNEFTGASVKLKAYGAGFEAVKEIDVPVKAATHEVSLDLAALKLPPGEHTLAFVGSAVSKYRYNPAAVPLAEAAQKKAEAEMKIVANVPEKKKAAEAAMAEATKRMKVVTDAATPKDTVDIIVSEPVKLLVKPAQVASVTK